MTAPTVVAGATLVERVGWTRSWPPVAAVVIGAAGVTAMAAQFRIQLSFTPVPITGQTFAVLLAGASLGARLGAASQALYFALGMLGAPVYADATGGWSAATGSTAGYLVGFVAAAAVVGALAQRRQDRDVLTAVPAMLAGTAVIYTLGAVWLAVDLNTSLEQAVELGVAPFLIGDALKLTLAGLALPTTWRFVETATSERGTSERGRRCQ